MKFKLEIGNQGFHLGLLSGGNFKLRIKNSREITLSREELRTLRNAMTEALDFIDALE